MSELHHSLGSRFECLFVSWVFTFSLVMATVLITGVTGYVGSWCMQKSLEAGHTVIGTVRDPESKKCAFLKEAMEGVSKKISSKAKTNLRLVKADLLSGEEAWDKIFADYPEIEFVLHTASPYFATEPKDPNDYIKPAVEGTTCVVKAAVKHNVKRVVVTSSVAAVWDPLQDGKTYTPADWSDPALQGSYGKSKTLAEKAAWRSVEGSQTELCTVNPMFIVGPTLYSDASLIGGFESGALITKICTGKMSLTPKMMMGITDVRDVATVHVQALACPAAAGKRFLCTNKPEWFSEVQAKFATPAGVRSASNLPSCCFCFLQICLPEAKAMKKNLGKRYDVDARQTNEVLNFQFIPEEETAREMVEDLVVLGVLKAK